MRNLCTLVLLCGCNALGGEHIVREVPHHDVSLLADCPGESAAAIQHEIAVAISLGAPTYNNGDFEGCYRTYANAAMALNAREKACAGARKALMAGVEKASKLRTFDAKAWAMRDAFDGLLDVIDRSGRAEAPAGATTERHVPRLPLKSLEDCEPKARAHVAQVIGEAIDVGAPLFNDGNADACARVYVGAARELLSDLEGCAHVRKLLDGAVSGTRTDRDGTAKAWRMRDVFDGLLEVIERKTKNAAHEI